MTRRAVYVVDDEVPIRRSLHLLLRAMNLAPELFAGGENFLDHLGQLAPGCVLLDLRMPEIDGLEVQRRLLAAASPHSIIVMSGHGDLEAALTAMEQGAMAFLEKPFSRAALAELLDLGFLRLEDSPRYHVHVRAAAGALGRLSAAERRLLDRMVRGHDLDRIAAQTGVPQATLEIERSRIFAQLGVTSLVDALRMAFAARRASAL